MVMARPAHVCTILFAAFFWSQALIAKTSGFVTPPLASQQPHAATISRQTTELLVTKDRPIKDISYGEDSRKYRRTVYTHDDWKKHRSPDRFLYYIISLFSSGIYKNIGREVTAATAIATFVCFWNCLAGDYQDLSNVSHPGFLSGILPVLGLPINPFTLASPSLGLLLGMYFGLMEHIPHWISYCSCHTAHFCSLYSKLNLPSFVFHSLSYQHVLQTLG